MKTILQAKLLPSKEQVEILLETMKRFNSACDYISEIAFKEKCFSKYDLHKKVYYDVKERFSLSAQVAIRAIGKTVDSYKLDKKVQRTFRPYGAMIFDQRIMSFKGIDKVSLWTLEGRQLIQMIYGDYQERRWGQRKGQVNLIYKDNDFYLMISIETDRTGILVGQSYSGEITDSIRTRLHALRTSLQKCGTKSAKRHL